MMGLRIRCVCWRPHVLASVNERVEKLDADLAEMASLEAAISRSIKKGIQDGLAVGIDHGRAGRSLADIVAYNPPVQVDFNSALQELCEVDFRLLANLKSHKDASIEDVMNLLRLESPLADAPSMDSLQHDIEQLKVPIHRANITEKRSALLGVWTPLSKPFSNGFGMQFTGITASVLYVSKNGVSLLLDLIMSLACGCLTEAKHWRIHSFSHQSLNGLSLNCFPLSDMISPGRSNLHTMLSHTNFLTWAPVIVAIGEGLGTRSVEGGSTSFRFHHRACSSAPTDCLDCADSELEVSLEKFFDESGGADQGDYAAGGGQEIEDEIVSGVSGAASAGKSPTILKQLLASSILNVESGVEAVATLPFVTSTISATLEHESGAPTDSITGLNLRTIGASKRFVISSDSSHHSNTNVPGAEGDSLIRSAVVPPVMTKAVITTHVASIPFATALESGTKVITLVHASMFHDSESTGTNKWAYEDGKEISLSGKVRELQSMVSVKDRELKDVDATVTSLKSQNDGLADQVRVLETTCSGLQYLTALEVAISRSIEKGIHDGLAVGIDHGRAWRSLADIIAYNPSVEVDFNSALQELFEHDIEQLKVPIHSTSISVPDATGTTTALSTTFASASSIPPISVEDYEIIHADGQENSLGNVQGNAATVEFKKEDLDTTLERDFLN
ncbi:hypothetical protein Tco_0706553 [Tanacetum coccineum]|uniref:Uncharacterized protein n=1 Tax=Tanacetum coccineum TaxID=301880 RepID=A0ABQ4Y8P0_9ASTR